MINCDPCLSEVDIDTKIANTIFDVAATIDYAAGPGIAGNANAVMATFGSTTPRIVFATDSPGGGDTVWATVRNSSGDWVWVSLLPGWV